MRLTLASSRTAVTGADDAFHARLRGRYGLTPAGAPLDARTALAYCGREFRVYPSMRVGEAARFYGALNDRWNSAALRDDLSRAGIGDDFEVRRMKRAYQRALVLAFALAAEPTLLVVEAAEEFDGPATEALLARSIERVAVAVVTYGAQAAPPAGLFSTTLAAEDLTATWA